MGDCASITSWNKCKPSQNGRNGHYIQDLLVILALIDQLGSNVIQLVCKYAKYVKYAEYVKHAYSAYYMNICIIPTRQKTGNMYFRASADAELGLG